MSTDAMYTPRLSIQEARLHPLLKSVSIHEISCNALRELSVQCRVSIRPTNRIKMKSILLNFIRHKQAPTKESHSVPFLPPWTHTSDTLVRDGNSCTPGGMLEILGVIQAFFSLPPPEAQRTVSAKILSLLLSGNFKQTNCSMCPTTFLMPFGKRTKALQKCLLSKLLQS